MKACDSKDSSQSLSEKLYQDERVSATRPLVGGFEIVLDEDPSREELRHPFDSLIAVHEHECDRKSREVESSLLSGRNADIHHLSDTQDQLVDALIIDTEHMDIKMPDAKVEARIKSLAIDLKCMGLEVANLGSTKLHSTKDNQQDCVDRWNAQ